VYIAPQLVARYFERGPLLAPAAEHFLPLRLRHLLHEAG
jgi:hypothetical protein